MVTLSRFKTLKLPVINNNLKHLFIENQLSVVYLRTMKVIWIKHKKSLIDTLLFRCFSICSDYTSFHLEVENLREILKKNSYSSGIIEQFIRSFSNKLHSTSIFGNVIIQFKAKIKNLIYIFITTM